MFGITSEGRGQYGAGHRRVGEDLDTFVERSLEAGHQPDAIRYPQEATQD
jgi:hypothetical protein